MKGEEEPRRIVVRKENGETEPYDPQKVREALLRAGMGQKEASEILAQLEPKLRDGITTKQIFRAVFGMVELMKPEVSHKYNLKRALMDIGPEGYEFEDFTARLLDKLGYSTSVRQKMAGRCVTHELDVVAKKKNDSYSIECKFHNQPGAKCRIQTALYVYARYLDLREGAKLGTCPDFTAPWLITNTKLSEDVVIYGECVGLRLLGWRYPVKDSLESLIDKTHCYPISVIKMSSDDMRKMLRRKIVVVDDIPESPAQLSEFANIPQARAKEIIERAEFAR